MKIKLIDFKTVKPLNNPMLEHIGLFYYALF